MSLTIKYGEGDNTFKAAGGQAGITRLVERFYTIMESDPQYLDIWNMHPKESAEDNAGLHYQTQDKLARFLCAWMGGPRLYKEKYGSISIPAVHAHLAIGEQEHDQWLACMQQALGAMDYEPALVDYLMRELAVPAGRVLQ